MDDTWWRTPEQLDQYQQAIISLPADGDHLVLGPPGSGKTNLLLLRAAYLVRTGRPHIAVITFNRLLKEFLATGSNHYPFDAERIQTFRSWGADLIRAHGCKVDTDGEFEEVRANILSSLHDLRAGFKNQLKYDVILVDEAQDYTIPEIDVMRECSNNIFAVGDDNQRIYRNDGAIDHLASFCRTAPTLRFHYRNGLAICRMADGIVNDPKLAMVPTCNYDEARYPSAVQRFGGLTLEEQVQRAVPDLKTQLVAYPDEWIAILAPLSKSVGKIFDLLEQTEIGDRVQIQRYEDGYESLDHSRPIIVSTMHSAKGLEYRAVHLLAVDTITRHRQTHPRLAYTAVTRAKTSLSIYHGGAIPAYMERGLVAVRGVPVQAPSLSELFGKAP